MKYPNPCDTCTKTNCTQFNCPDLRKRVNTIWKQFNGYPSRAYRAQKRTTNKKFVYEHPDIIRQYLANGPCTRCQREKVCDTPCSTYWRWWDARMEWFRRMCRSCHRKYDYGKVVMSNAERYDAP